MNQRIRELMLAAGYAAPELAGRANKLAELIIQECVDTVLDSSVEYTTRPQIAEELSEHFGVKQ